jgi:hypothetical protein
MHTTARPRRRTAAALALAAALAGLAAGVTVQRLLIPARIVAALGLRDSPRRPPGRRALPRGLPPSTLRGKRALVALVAGQSNAANYGAGRYAAGPGVFAFYLGKLYPAEDPLPGADGDGASAWPRLGDALVRSGRYRAAVFACVAQGNSEARRWAPGGDLYPRLVYALRDLRAAGLPATHLLWHQGETDAELRTDPGEYRESLRALVAGLRAEGFAGRAYLTAGTRRGIADDPALRAAAASLADPAAGVYPGPDSDGLGVEYREGGGTHFNETGLQRLAELWAARLAE